MAKITTIHGLMDEDELVHKTSTEEDEDKIVSWSEYRLKSDPQGEVVHRSVHVHLKKNPMMGATGAALGA
jgi:hypothetical protein